MPIVLWWMLVRIVRAMNATVRLLFDWKLMRAMPWSYIRTLPRRDPWIGIATLTLAVAVVTIPIALVLPRAAAEPVYLVGITFAGCGVVSSWIRHLAARH